MRFATRMSRLGTETAFEVLAKARSMEAKGRSIIHLEIGEPDFDTPRNIVEAGIRALRDGHTHYGPPGGLPRLREAIAAHVTRSRGIDVTADRVVVTPGAKPILFFTVLALIEPGDEVIFPNPGFPIYESVIRFVGATPVPLRLRGDTAFRVDPDEVAGLITDRTRLLILNYPQNPTGGTLAAEAVESIAAVAVERGIPVLADEIYSEILYDGEFRSILTHPGMEELGILLDGFSKTYAMTGWRLGYGVLPRPLVPHVERLMVNSNSCTAAFTQIAGVEALEGPRDEVDRMIREFKTRRDVIVDGLNRIEGFSCHRPEGAFYVFPDVTGTGMSSRDLESRFLEEAGVASLSGTSFGAFGDGYLRFSYANSVENIREALRRIEETLLRRRP